MTRRLKIDMTSLEMAFEASDNESPFYLDLEKAEVLQAADEAQSDFERLSEEAEEAGIEVEEALAMSDLQDWEKEMVSQILRIESGLGTTVIEIPPEDSREGYRDMEAFIESVGDSPLKRRLADAIAGGRPFRRFKDVIAAYPEERERWFAFQDARQHQRMLDWLEEQGIEVVD